MNKIKLIDQYLSDLIFTLLLPLHSKVIRNKKLKSLFISISNKTYSNTEDRTSIHFNLLSQAESEYKFYSIKVSKFIPSFFYSIRLVFLMRNYECKILLFDYNPKTRFPNLILVKKLVNNLPVICFWLETFDESTSPIRILPTLNIIDFHIVTDDPGLRIKGYAKCKEFADRFYYFPLPIIPEKMFYNYSSIEKKYDLCFYGNVENSIHRSERKKILEFLTNESLYVHGFSSEGRHDKGRPSYDEMLNGLRESRIGLNFSNHGQVGAVTNRVVEIIASGTVLLSSSEEVLKELIRPNKEYVCFMDERDLMEKIKSLLENETGLREISEAASKSISSRYSAEKFIYFIESLVD
jgi:glycosyltransferase involved in cell wall biosynthesis